MLESVALWYVLSLLINYLRVTSIYHTFDKMCCVINFIQLFHSTLAFLEFFLSLSLEHLTTLANKIIPGSHLLRMCFLEGQKTLEI